MAEVVDAPQPDSPCFITGDVVHFLNIGSKAFLHMTADEHDVGCWWRDRNHWHTFVLAPEGPPGVPLRGGDCVWLWRGCCL